MEGGTCPLHGRPPHARCWCDDSFITLRQHGAARGPAVAPLASQAVPSEQLAWLLAARCNLHASQRLPCHETWHTCPPQAVEGLAGAVGEGTATVDKAAEPGEGATEEGAGARAIEGGGGEAGGTAQPFTPSCHDSAACGGGTHDTPMPAQHAVTAAVPAQLEELLTTPMVRGLQ